MITKLKVLAICLCFVFTHVANAEDANLIASDTLDIYAEGEDLHAARLQALQDGYQKAFDGVLHRLYPFYYHQRTSNLRNIKLQDLIDHYDVSHERLNSNSYRAKLTVFFSITELRRVLSGLGVVHKFTLSPVILILPVLCTQGQCNLWQNPTWRDVWDHAPDNVGLLQIAYPLGDLGDLELLGKNPDFLNYSYNDLKPLLDRYEAAETAIILAEYAESEMKITIRHVMEKVINIYHMQYRRNIDESEEEFYKRISEDLLNRLDAKWKGMNTFLNEQPYIFYLKIASPTPVKWATIRDKLRSTPHVLGVSVRSSSYDAMEISLKFDVLPATIASYLKDAGLIVYKESGETYLALQ